MAAPVPILLATAAAMGCSFDRVPDWVLDQPAARAPSLRTGACDPSLRVIGETVLGADVGAAIEVAGRVYAATGTGVASFPADAATGGGPEDILRWNTPGESLSVAADAEFLWVADGTAGLARFPLGGLPGARLDRWDTGGRVTSVATSGGRVWAADSSGRVLTIPSRAPPGTPPVTLEVDGWPAQVAPVPGGALVAAGPGGVMHVVLDEENGRMSLADRPCPTRDARRVAARGEWVFVADRSDVVRCSGGGVAARVNLPGRVEDLRLGGPDLWIAAGAAGLFRWDGRTKEATRADAGGQTPDDRFAVLGSFPASAGGWWIAGGWTGLHWLPPGDAGAPRRMFRGGFVQALEPWPNGLVAGVALSHTAGELALLEMDPDGSGRVQRRWTAPGQPAALLADPPDLLVGTLGAGLSVEHPGTGKPVQPAGGSAHGTVSDGADRPIRGGHVHALAALSPGRAAAVQNGRLFTFLARGTDGRWRETGQRDFQPFPIPSGLAALRDEVVTASLYDGSLLAARIDGAGDLRRFGARGPAGFIKEPSPLARLRAWEGALWVAEPALGLERIPSGPDKPSTLVRSAPGAWDAVPWRGWIAVARGTAGVSLWRPETWEAAGSSVRPSPGSSFGPDPSPDRSCDLPGDTRHLVRDASRLWVASTGSVFTLEVADQARPVPDPPVSRNTPARRPDTAPR